MPWSPVPKMPGVIEDLKARGFGEREFFMEDLEISIIMQTGLTRPGSIGRVAELMVKLGYLKKTTAGFEIIRKEKPLPPTDPEKEIDNFLNNLPEG